MLVFSDDYIKECLEKYSKNRQIFKRVIAFWCAISLIFVHPLATLDSGAVAFVSKANNAAIYLAWASVALYIFGAAADEIYAQGFIKAMKNMIKTFYITAALRITMAWGLMYFAPFK